MPPEHKNAYLVLSYTQTKPLASMEQHLYSGRKKREFGLTRVFQEKWLSKRAVNFADYWLF